MPSTLTLPLNPPTERTWRAEDGAVAGLVVAQEVVFVIVHRASCIVHRALQRGLWFVVAQEDVSREALPWAHTTHGQLLGSWGQA